MHKYFALKMLRSNINIILESYSIKHNEMFANWGREWGERITFTNSIPVQQIGCINKSSESHRRTSTGAKAMKIL